MHKLSSIDVTNLKQAISHASSLSPVSEDVLFENVTDELGKKCYVNTRAQKLAIDSIMTYHRLVQLSQNSTQFEEVLCEAKKHIMENLGKWYESELRHAMPQEHQEQDLFRAQHDGLTKWIFSRLKAAAEEDHSGVMNSFYLQQPEAYNEEEETILIISLFSVVFERESKEYFDAKILCDVAHPVRQGDYDDATILECLNRLNADACRLTEYLLRIESAFDLSIVYDTKEAKELLRRYAMKLWKSVRCLKLVAFTSKTLLEVMHMPTYVGEAMWTHKNNSKWPLGVRVRDSPIIESITIGVIVMIGLLCSSAKMPDIIRQPDVALLKRACGMLNQITNDQPQSVQSGISIR